MFYLEIPKYQSFNDQSSIFSENGPVPIFKMRDRIFQWHKEGMGSYEDGLYGILDKKSMLLGDRLCLVWKGQLLDKAALCAELQTFDQEDINLVFAAFERWGSSCVSCFEGDFALVIWQVEKNQILAARDAMGCHTLYYAETAEHYLFSDDARRVARGLSPHPRLSQRGLLMWAQNAYDETIPLFENVKGLGPAEALVIHGDQKSVTRYWDAWETSAIRYANVEAYAEQLKAILASCVSDRSRSGNLGSMLSGGLDSATVTALAAKYDPELLGLTYQFRALKTCDEWPKAAGMMHSLALQHLPLDSEAHWLLKGNLPPPWQEDPFQSWDMLTHQAMLLLKANGKRVLLTGHGGDNMFTGYSRALLAGMQLPSASWDAWAHWYQVQSRTSFSLPRGVYRYLFRPKLQAHHKRLRRWPERFPFIRRSACKRVFPNGFSWLPKPGGKDPQRQAMIWMATDFSMGVRRAIHWYHRVGEAHEIQVHHPLFDRRLAEFMTAIPPECVRAGEKSKGLLRLAMNDLLPPMILKQHEKPSLAAFYYQGINLEQHLIKHYTKEMYLEKLGMVDAVKLRRAVDNYLQGDPNSGLAWFLPVVLTEAWLRVALEQGYTI